MSGALGGALVGGGCTLGTSRDWNARPVLGGVEGVPGLVVIPVRRPMSDSASLRSVSRVEWDARRVVVPVDGTVHGPIYRMGRTPARLGSRRQGLWPTPESAVRLDSGPDGELRREALWAPLEALGEVVLLPLGVAVDVVRGSGLGEGARRASPWALHKRYPETGEWRNVSGASLRGRDDAAPAPAEAPGPVPIGGREAEPDREGGGDG